MNTQPVRIRTIPQLALLVLLVAGAACTSVQPTTVAPTDTPLANMPNPASVYCQQQGYTSEIRTAADGSQSGVCVFPNGSECDEWAYFRGECAPAGQGGATTSPTEIPTLVPFDQSDYQGWWTYTHPVYGFSIMLPEDWIVEETTGSDALMNGHFLSLHEKLQGVGAENVQIRMAFRRVGEETPLWPTGVGSGQFLSQGTLDVAGGPVRRILFVCPGGQVNDVWYHGSGEDDPNIRRGDLEFGFIASLTGFYCEEGHSLGGKLLRVAEMVVASLWVP
jgi:putative hemolysin